MSDPEKIIAVDIDDVLAANAESFVAFSNERWGTKLATGDYNEHWAEMWGIDNEETEKRAHEFHNSGAIGRYRHYNDAKPVLAELSAYYKLVIITSRRRIVHDETLEWINLHFEDVFQEVHFAGMWDEITKDSSKATKAALCVEIGAGYLIDDQLKHCLAAAEAGLQTLLFGDYSWNYTDSLPDGVTRVRDWAAVKDYFNELTKE